MPSWDTYPPTYRAAEVQSILAATRAGECVAVVGLSGAGKSNLLGFLAARQNTPLHPLLLVDGNRLTEPTPAAFLRLMGRALEADTHNPDPLAALDDALIRRFSAPESSALTLLLDVSFFVDRAGQGLGGDRLLFNNLRALRDAHKFRLTYVLATRYAISPRTELAELFYGRTLWLGPLAPSDAHWNVMRFAARHGMAWDESAIQTLIALSGRYPALLKAACEAYADGALLTLEALAAHPAVERRLAEFWADAPTEAELRAAHLADVPLLQVGRVPPLDTTHLTAKEHALLQYLQAHAGEVCAKDDLIRAVWPEDAVYTQGVRDDSLAQLIRRLREKIEPDPARPRHVQTLPGRGYRLAGSDG
jgi:hypothetical protein